jgi:hypothetical protein
MAEGLSNTPSNFEKLSKGLADYLLNTFLIACVLPG